MFLFYLTKLNIIYQLQVRELKTNIVSFRCSGWLYNQLIYRKFVFVNL
jgi:hypothetical protein